MSALNPPLSADEILRLRQLLGDESGRPRSGFGVPMANAAIDFLPRLLHEVERHRANLVALESNLSRWPKTYDTGRTIEAVKAARAGFLLETLT